jgi:hypothetical protein
MTAQMLRPEIIAMQQKPVDFETDLADKPPSAATAQGPA